VRRLKPGLLRRGRFATSRAAGDDVGNVVDSDDRAPTPITPTRTISDRSERGYRPSIVFYTDSVEIGGAEISLATLLASLSGEFAATVMAADRRVLARVVRDAQGVATCLVPPVRSKRDVRAFIAHLRSLRRIRPDIFQANLITPWHCRYGIVAALLTRGTRVVVVEHWPRPIDGRLKPWLKKLLARACVAHVAVGERSARDVERIAGLPSGFARAIHNGVRDRPLRTVARPTSGAVVGSVGRLDSFKRFDALVRLLPALPSVTALLVGDGAERAALEELAADLGVRDRLVITGWNDDARDYLTALDVFVLPSDFEGFPLAIVEAMLAEVPVVATDVGSVGDAVVDGVTGLLVPPGDSKALLRAIESLLADEDLRRRLAARGRQLAVERFSADVMARSYEKLWHEVLA
jgi:glycosyltransferase involved in cell wall biosynthesis